MDNRNNITDQSLAESHSVTTISTLANDHVTKLERRLLKSAFLTLIAFLGTGFLHAQRRDTSALEKGPVRWLQVEKSFGVLTEMDFVNGGMGLTICRGRFIRGTQRAMAGNGYYIGGGYDTDHAVSHASAGAWVGYFKRKFGVQAAVKGVYYIGRREQVFAIRPEAGFGFPKANLLYGYNLFFENTELQLPAHTLTLYVYFGLHSSRVQMF